MGLTTDEQAAEHQIGGATTWTRRHRATSHCRSKR